MKNERESSKKFSLKRCAVGVGIVGGDVFINWGIDVASFVGASTFGFRNPMIDSHPVEALGITMGVGTAFSILSSIQNIRLNHKFGISPNLAAMLTYNLLDKKWPSRTKLRDSLTMVAQVVITKDPFLVTAALADRKVLAGVAMSKTVKTVYNLFKVVGSEIVLKKTDGGRKPEKANGRAEIALAGVVYSTEDK